MAIQPLSLYTKPLNSHSLNQLTLSQHTHTPVPKLSPCQHPLLTHTA